MRELERICLKRFSLSNRVADRYSTAADLASDLRTFLDAGDSPGTAVPPFSTPPLKETSGLVTGESEVSIVPKGSGRSTARTRASSSACCPAA